MRLKLSLNRAPRPIDVAITADATATVADVARMLRVADPTAPGAEGDGLTLRVASAGDSTGAARVIDGTASIADSSLVSGSWIELVHDAGALRHGDTARGAAVAQLRVISGPDAGREFALPAGATIVGRDRDVDVRLSDPMVSKRHARINVADTVEIVDLGSANGVQIDGDLAPRASLGPSDVVTLGDTTVAIVRLQQSGRSTPAPQVEHVRSPRVVPAYPGEEFPAPTPPKLPQRQRFPYLALLAPLLIGAVLWAVTQQLLGVIMMAMSPLLLVAGYVDQSMTAKRTLKAERKAFDASMLQTQETLERAREDERRVRTTEMPSSAQLQQDVQRLGPLLWTERPELPGFLVVNTGIGRAPSRNSLVLPTSQDTIAECWEQLVSLRDEYRWIDEVPLPLSLRECGSLGYAGAVGNVHAVARSAVFQLVARHSPAELVVAAMVPASASAEWSWLKWLPHSSSGHSPLAAAHLADGRTSAGALLAQLEGLIDARLDGEPVPRGPIDPSRPAAADGAPVPAVVLIVEHDAPVDRARLTRIAERGPDAGVHLVWVAPRTEQLPAACRGYVTVDSTGGGVLGEVRSGSRTAPIRLETMDAATADRLARLMSPVVDVGAPESDDSDLPRSVGYPSLVGEDVLDAPQGIVDRWRQSNSLTPRDGAPPVPRKKEGNLRAIVGHAGSAPFTLDLRADGPHALVGGTTGAGKSEFLQSWVLGMAAAHSPDRLTFLFVDYKGGSAFADCVDLPHTVGLVTDLSPHLVRRALTSLRAELRYREHLLAQKKKKDLIELEKTGDPDCPPSLVIIVDEFAALVQEVPEFVDGVVDVAQRGRSLGLHLVLATQRPAGVIRDNLRANTNLRIALRMADEDDSVDILGERSAAFFDPSIPGRGAAKTGPGRIRSFQTGYAGGRTTGIPPKPRIDVYELDFGGHAAWEAPQDEVAEAPETGPTDIARIVATVRAAAAEAGVPAPRKPWLDELAPIYSFVKLPNPRTDERLLLGVLDDPDTQSQPTVFYEPDRDGNLAIFGTGGSGKSTALRTIAVAAAATTRRGGPTHVYGLDFGSRGLSMLEQLPHVGAIVSGDDGERVVRTIRMLRDIVDERAERYAAVRAGSIGEYRSIAGAPDEPRILLLVDGIGVFKEQYEFGSATESAWFTAFAQIAADGRGVGVHVIVAGDRPNALPASIASTVQRRIVLRLANEDEYLMLGVPKDVLGAASPPGRAMLDGNELQLAILGDSGNVAVQAREIERLAGTLTRGGSTRAAEVRRLPEQVSLEDLPTGSAGRPIVGIEDLTLAPAVVPMNAPLMLVGPSGSGRSTVLAALSEALRRSDPDVRQIHLSPRRSALPSARWDETAVGAEQVAQVLHREARSADDPGAARLAFFIEAVPEFDATRAEDDIADLVKLAAREGFLVVGEGETSTWRSAPMLRNPFKAGRRGILLVPGEAEGELFDVDLGRLRPADFPPGRGLLVEGSRATKLQFAQTRGDAW